MNCPRERERDKSFFFSQQEKLKLKGYKIDIIYTMEKYTNNIICYVLIKKKNLDKSHFGTD